MRGFFLVFLLFIAAASPAFGQADFDCNCPEETSLDAQIDAASVVFRGTCVRVTTNPIKGGLNVTFMVDSSWKRAIEPYATVHTNAPGQCGVEFEEGESYLVFAHRRHQTIETTICEFNFPIGGIDAEKTMQVLGVGYGPGRPQMARDMSVLVLGLGIGGLIAVAFVVFRKRIFPRKA